MTADKSILYQVAYDEAVRALAEQQAEVDSFRARAGLLLSSAAITTSFLGAQFFGGGLTTTGWLALVAFVGAAATSLAILWPHPWELSSGPRQVIEPYIRREDPVPVEELHRELSLHMHSSYVENRAGIMHLAVLLQIASGLLTLEVIFWIIAIGTIT